MNKKVAVVGNGYVGTGMVNLFKDQFDVRIYDPAKGFDSKEHVQGCDLALVCVPTQPLPSGAADTSIVEDVMAWLEAELICIKSTVPPGTTDRLQKQYGHKAIHFSPEYMGEPRNYVSPHRYLDPRDARSHPFVIVGGMCASEVLDFFLSVMAVDARYIATSSIAAELCKYMENTYFATKVTFVNEWAQIAALHDVDFKELRELWLQDPRIDRDHTAFFADRPGFGGKCLPKDLSAIISHVEAEFGIRPPLLDAVQSTNKAIRGE